VRKSVLPASLSLSLQLRRSVRWFHVLGYFLHPQPLALALFRGAARAGNTRTTPAFRPLPSVANVIKEAFSPKNSSLARDFPSRPQPDPSSEAELPLHHLPPGHCVPTGCPPSRHKTPPPHQDNLTPPPPPKPPPPPPPLLDSEIRPFNKMWNLFQLYFCLPLMALDGKRTPFLRGERIFFPGIRLGSFNRDLFSFRLWRLWR